MTRISTALIGEETLLIACAEQLLRRNHLIRAVITRKPELRDWAVRAGIEVHETPEALFEVHARGAFDWLLSIANLTLLADDILALPTRGAINFHDGPLPRYAGLNTPVWALLAGEARHAITWHMMEAGADRGDILVTREIALSGKETAQDLNARCYAAGLEGFADLLRQMEEGQLQRQAQDFADRQVFARHHRPFAGGYLDFSQPAARVLRTVRALDFGAHANPLCLPRLFTGKGTVLVRKATPVEGARPREAAPGEVCAVSAEALQVMCADGAVALSGMVDESGRAVAPGDLAARGDVLAPIGEEMARQLREGAERLARHEPFWRARLARLEPLDVPLAAPAQRPADWESRALSLPSGCTRATAITVLAAWAAQGENRTSGDIAFAPAPLAALANAAPRLAAPWVPLRFEAGGSLAEAVAEMAKELAEAQAHPGFALDLALRDPALSGLRVPALAISEGDGAEIPGACIHARLDEGKCTLSFDRARLDTAAIDLLMARLTAMLARLASAPEGRLGIDALIALPDAERDALRDGWNRTEAEVDPEMSIHRAFEAQAARAPEAIALIFEDRELTAGEVNARANAVAAALRRAGVGRGVNVGLCLRRSPELVIGALAILKAGGAYVPLDPDHPAGRLAHILADSGARLVLADRPSARHLPRGDARVMLIEETGEAGEQGAPNVDGGSRPEDLAYLIYTSGSTGAPKGVMVEHRNVANFFRAMDDCVDLHEGAVWLAVTGIAFDISVLELFYTLARGVKVVISGGEHRAAVSGGTMAVCDRPMEFSLFYWGNDDGPGPQKYRLLLDGARFADAHGFAAVWTPERHFHAFGGPYPNPAVSGAAVAAVTENIAVRAGSIVAPLHHPARIAEDWAVIDNLTGGRTGLGMASGWHPHDFVLRPENTPPDNKAALFDTLDKLRRLWRGEAVEFADGAGRMIPTRTLPRPVSQEIECWITIAGNPETWRQAGEHGAHVLTHLLGQSISEVGEKIAIYHQALREAGHDPADFKVTLMLHSYIAADRATAFEVARKPMKDYLRSAAGLIKQFAWAFPAFKRPEGVTSPFDLDLGTLGDEEVEAILDFAFERYFEESGLFGSIEDGVARVEALKRIGVSEIACLIDFGIAPETALAGLEPLAEVMRRANTPSAPAADDFSLAAQIVRHGVTHLQMTPGMARLMLLDDTARTALRGLRQVLIGGEALPVTLLQELRAATPALIVNMYGPTETTIWSTARRVTGTPAGPLVGIGQPLANTAVHVLDAAGRLVPTGAAGELCIGGAGVARGYWQRDDLTAERFVTAPFDPGAGRIYRTGDLVRRSAQGGLDFLGRLDHQIKIRGHRIELGEIEHCLRRLNGVSEAVVVAHEAAGGDLRLAGYYCAARPLDEAALRSHLSATLPEVMVPADLIWLDAMPLTPNKKIDRAALPRPTRRRRAAPAAPAHDPTTTERRIAEIWARVLGCRDIRGEDSFFDLGGHSLLAVQAHRDLRTAFAGARLTITDVFRFPVLRDLARHIDAAAGAAPAPDGQDGRSEDAPAPARAETISRRRMMRAARQEQGS